MKKKHYESPEIELFDVKLSYRILEGSGGGSADPFTPVEIWID